MLLVFVPVTAKKNPLLKSAFLRVISYVYFFFWAEYWLWLDKTFGFRRMTDSLARSWLWGKKKLAGSVHDSYTSVDNQFKLCFGTVWSAAQQYALYLMSSPCLCLKCNSLLRLSVCKWMPFAFYADSSSLKFIPKLATVYDGICVRSPALMYDQKLRKQRLPQYVRYLSGPDSPAPPVYVCLL